MATMQNGLVSAGQLPVGILMKHHKNGSLGNYGMITAHGHKVDYSVAKGGLRLWAVILLFLLLAGGIVRLLSQGDLSELANALDQDNDGDQDNVDDNDSLREESSHQKRDLRDTILLRKHEQKSSSGSALRGTRSSRTKASSSAQAEGETGDDEADDNRRSVLDEEEAEIYSEDTHDQEKLHVPAVDASKDAATEVHKVTAEGLQQEDATPIAQALPAKKRKSALSRKPDVQDSCEKEERTSVKALSPKVPCQPKATEDSKSNVVTIVVEEVADSTPQISQKKVKEKWLEFSAEQEMLAELRESKSSRIVETVRRKGRAIAEPPSKSKKQEKTRESDEKDEDFSLLDVEEDVDQNENEADSAVIDEETLRLNLLRDKAKRGQSNFATVSDIAAKAWATVRGQAPTKPAVAQKVTASTNVAKEKAINAAHANLTIPKGKYIKGTAPAFAPPPPPSRIASIAPKSPSATARTVTKRGPVPALAETKTNLERPQVLRPKQQTDTSPDAKRKRLANDNPGVSEVAKSGTAQETDKAKAQPRPHKLAVVRTAKRSKSVDETPTPTLRPQRRPPPPTQTYRKSDLTNKFDAKIKQKLDEADTLLAESKFDEALDAYDELRKQHPGSPRAQYGYAHTQDILSERRQSNTLLEQAIAEYERILLLPDVTTELLLLAVGRLVDRCRFRGWLAKAVQVQRRMVDQFPDNLNLLNDFGVTFLQMGRYEDAKNVFQDVLHKDPQNGFASVHLGYILKTVDDRFEDAVEFLKSGIESGHPGTLEGKFFFHLGDALLRLKRNAEAINVFELGAKSGFFLSTFQRSLLNVEGLTAKPLWQPQETTYQKYFSILEKNWRLIRDEALAIIEAFEPQFSIEDPKLIEQGNWTHFVMFQSGKKLDASCTKAPKTCALINTIPPVVTCHRCQVQFSLLKPDSRVWPHCGPTNTRLRAQLGLQVPSSAKLQVGQEPPRMWRLGRVLVFDDSFEHQMYNDGKNMLVLLNVDFWHPELTVPQKITLPPV